MIRTLEEKIAQLEALAEKERELPAGDEAANVRKRISDIRGLIIKADGAMQSNHSPEKYFAIIDNIFEDLEHGEKGR